MDAGAHRSGARTKRTCRGHGRTARARDRHPGTARTEARPDHRRDRSRRCRSHGAPHAELVRLKPDTTTTVRSGQRATAVTELVRLKPDATTTVRPKADATTTVRLKPDTTTVRRHDGA